MDTQQLKPKVRYIRVLFFARVQSRVGAARIRSAISLFRVAK